MRMASLLFFFIDSLYNRHPHPLPTITLSPLPEPIFFPNRRSLLSHQRIQQRPASCTSATITINNSSISANFHPTVNFLFHSPGPIPINQFILRGYQQMQQGRQQQSQEQPGGRSVSGVEAIFSHKSFSSHTSSLLFYSVRSYVDIDHSSMIHESLLETDPNFMYSVNSSALWMLLRDKIKRLSKLQLFEGSADKIVIKFATTFASFLALNEAKEKLLDPSKEPLRKDIREFIHNKLKKEGSRKSAILQEFARSEFFNRIAEELKLSKEDKEELKKRLVEFNFTRNAAVTAFLQRCLNHLQKAIQRKDAESRQQGVTKSGGLTLSGGGTGGTQGVTREAYSILLLCNYLNIYVVIGDWIRILLNDKEKKLSSLIFAHIVERKGFHIINRVLDDAPLNAIAQEIKAFQSNFYK